MKRIAAGLVTAALLWLAPLASADSTFYVNTSHGNAQDIDDGVHGKYSDQPWKTLSYAMTKVSGPKTSVGDVIIRVSGNYTSAGSVSFNPVNAPANGKEYFFYGDTANPYNVQINLSGTTAVKLCSTYVNIKGFWFRDGLNITSHPSGFGTYYSGTANDSANQTTWRLSHTRRRLFNTVRKCVLGDSTPGNVASTGIAVEASNCFVGNSRIIAGKVEVGRTGGGTAASWRKRTAGVWLDGLTGHWTAPGEHIISFGSTYDDGCNGHCAANMQAVDSLKVWFCTFRAKVCATKISGTQEVICDKHVVSAFHSHNMSLRGNHWYLGTAGQAGDERVFSLRDSMDNVQIDRDTLIITDDPVGQDVKMLVGYNSTRAGSRRVHWVVDSSYWQVPRIEWSNALSGTFTYTSFVAKQGLSFVDNTDWVDSLQTNTFNHCTIVSTSDPTNPVISFNSLDKQANLTVDPPTYGWPSTITNGNVLVFKNNLLFRAKWWTQPGICYNHDPFPVMTFGDCFNTANPKRDNSLRMTLANNLYVTGNYIWQHGDLSMGWRARHLADTCSATGYRRSSRPGDVGAYGFKALADGAASQAAGGPQGYAAAAASNYDSLGTYCYPADVQFESWFGTEGVLSDSLFDRVWVTGKMIDLNIPYTSFARGRGEAGTDVGAATVRASPLITFVNNDTVVAVTDDSSDPYEDTVVIRNDGNADLDPIFTVEPLGQYFAVIPTGIGAGFPLAAGASLTLNITLVDPSFTLPVGTYYLDVVITHGTTSLGTVGRRIRYNISRSAYSIDE